MQPSHLAGRSIDELVAAALAADEDSDVRDWATFGLAQQITLDTPAIREVLARRLTDSDDDTRAEAIVGLAERGDERAVAPLVAMIDGGWEGMLIRQAVEALRHPDVLAALTRLLEILGPDDAKERAWAEALLADAS
jgi:HEAT repeat protein